VADDNEWGVFTRVFHKFENNNKCALRHCFLPREQDRLLCEEHAGEASNLLWVLLTREPLRIKINQRWYKATRK